MAKLKAKIKNPYIMYTILFFIIWSIITLPFFLRGNSLIGQIDSFYQSFPVFIYIGDYIKELIRGNIIQFDFRIGLGDDVISALNWHGLGDIFQIISAFVSAEYSEWAYELVMILKYYLCGIAFLFYCKYYLQNRYYQVAGALMYALSAFALFWGLNCWMFLNPMITLPFILHGIDLIIENPKKSSYSMIFALFVQALNGFYFLYMEIIIAILYFMIIMWNRKKSKSLAWSQIIRITVAAALQGVLGCLMGAVLLLPSIMGYLSSARGERSGGSGSIISLLMFDDYAYYLDSFASMLIPDVYQSIITIPVIVLLGGIVLLWNSKQKEIKTLMIFFTVAFWIPFVGKVMNGFSYWTDRWYFTVLLFLILGTMTAIEEGIRVGKREGLLFGAIAATSMIIHFVNSEKTIGLAIQILVFAFLGAGVVWIWNRTIQREKMILCSVAVLVTVNGLLVFGPKILGGCGYSAGFKAKGEAYTEINSNIEKVEKADKGFQRFDFREQSLGASLVTNYFGTTEYFSMINEFVVQFYREMHISPGLEAAHILRGLDGRLELETLLSVSQYMDFITDEKGEKETVMCMNGDRLPLGFTYAEIMGREEFDKLNAVEKLSAMVNYLVIEEPVGSLAEVKADQVLNSNVNREIPIKIYETEIEHNGNQFTTNEKSRIRVYLQDVEMDKEYYVRFSDFYLLDADDEAGLYIYVGNKNLQIRSEKNVYYMGLDEFWVNVSELKQDENGNYFDIIFNGNKSWSLGKIQVYEHTPNRKALLSRNNYTLEDNRVKF